MPNLPLPGLLVACTCSTCHYSRLTVYHLPGQASARQRRRADGTRYALGFARANARIRDARERRDRASVRIAEAAARIDVAQRQRQRLAERRSAPAPPYPGSSLPTMAPGVS